MEKISKIIPPNRRTQPEVIPVQSNKPGVLQSKRALENSISKSLDKAVQNPQLEMIEDIPMKSAPVDLEIPVVKESIQPQDKVSISEPSKNSAWSVEKKSKQSEQGYEKMKEAQKSQMVEKLSQKFFGPQVKGTTKAQEIVNSTLPKSEEVAEQVERNQQLIA